LVKDLEERRDEMVNEKCELLKRVNEMESTWLPVATYKLEKGESSLREMSNNLLDLLKLPPKDLELSPQGEEEDPEVKSQQVLG